MKLVSFLYRAARTANTINAITKPRRFPRRVKNIIIGRAIGKTKIWK